ncbi:3' terminal RNA ribose 2'-O-methyltransferase Hen1 [Chitinimonas lacunae]|uniref:Small RNA 2'-O-methyltransferase n=1 Tax=Chitinimonas lacunae TaxID=1963018 RepID=A0ABV8MSQ4_9NEIS
MLITLSTTHQPASDLGYLLHKHPAKLQRFEQAFGTALVFYPEATETRCTAALLVDIDPVRLVRGRGQQEGLLEQYVNDRPYAASSLLAVALGDVFRSALAGRCQERPALVDQPLPLTVELPVVPCRGDRGLLEALFEPLGYQIEARALPYDPAFPAWGDSPYFSLTLHSRTTLRTLLSHLYVLLPVLDNDKHYWIGDAEVDKLLRHGSDWLGAHPHKALIARRYLKHQGRLTRLALMRLVDEMAVEDSEQTAASADTPAFEVSALSTASAIPTPAPASGLASEPTTGSMAEPALSLNQRRLEAVRTLIAGSGACHILDVGCGDGKLLTELARHSRAGQRLVGLDASSRALEIAADRLSRLTPGQRERVSLLHGSLTYRDARIEGFDLAACIEVIEHLDPGRVAMLTRVLFGHARPRRVLLSTPNRDYNVRYPNLRAGALRHADHRFEWSRAEFAAWAAGVARDHGYSYELAGIGEADAELGHPTQIAIFCIDDARAIGA